MKVLARVAAFALALLVSGSVTLTYPSATPSSDVRQVETPLAPLAGGSSVTGSGTEATASVGGSLISLKTNVLYLNNTNATGVSYAKINAVSSSGVSNLVSLTVGINNGTADTAQVTGALGAITQSGGDYVRLEPASTNRIFLTQAVTLVGPDASLVLDIVTSDTTDDSAYMITNANLTIT